MVWFLRSVLVIRLPTLSYGNSGELGDRRDVFWGTRGQTGRFLADKNVLTEVLFVVNQKQSAFDSYRYLELAGVHPFAAPVCAPEIFPTLGRILTSPEGGRCE